MTRTTSVNLGDLATPFDAWCSARGVSRSFAIRQLVAATIGNEYQPSLPLHPSVARGMGQWRAPNRATPGPSRSFTLKMTPEQFDHLKLRAAKTGMSCQRYVLAAITARDSDAGAIAGKDAVQALNRSNALLAQALVHDIGRDIVRDRLTASAPIAASQSGNLVEFLREHLSQAARVLSDVELTRAGHTLPKREAGGKARAKPGGPRRDPGALG